MKEHDEKWFDSLQKTVWRLFEKVNNLVEQTSENYIYICRLREEMEEMKRELEEMKKRLRKGRRKERNLK